MTLSTPWTLLTLLAGLGEAGRQLHLSLSKGRPALYKPLVGWLLV